MYQTAYDEYIISFYRARSVNPKTTNTDAQLNKLFDDLKKDTADSYDVKLNLGGGGKRHEILLVNYL